MYQALCNTMAQYLVEDCQLVSITGRRRLQSAGVDTCIVPLTGTRLGDRSFSVAGRGCGTAYQISCIIQMSR